MFNLDNIVQSYLSLVRTSSVTQFFYLLTIIFDFSLHFIFLSLCIAGLIFLVRNIKYSFLFLFSICFGAGSAYLLKMFFNVSRPMDGVVSVIGKSFPSGHATVSTIFFVMLMFIFDDYFTGLKRRIFHFICMTSIFLVAISRIYLGVHWVSDVAGGILLGLMVSYISVYIFRFVVEKNR